MDEKGFRDFCNKGERVRKGLSEETIQANLEVVKAFEIFLKKNNDSKEFHNAATKDLQSFVQYLIKKGENTWGTFLGLLRYARFVNNKEVEIALQQLLDGSNVLEDLSKTVRKTVGESKYKGYC